MLFAFDLDKTLVTDDHRLPEDTARTIDAVRRAGHFVTVLTGRPRASARPFLEQLEVHGPFSVNHGVLVYGPDGALMRDRRVKAAEVRRLLERYERMTDVSYACVAEDTLFVRDPAHAQWSWAHAESRTVERLDLGACVDADKIVILANGRSTTIEQEIREALPGAITYLWEDGFLEVTGPESDKGEALALIAETLGVPREQTIAFGDGLNDITMLGWAGRSIAVGPYVHPDALALCDEHVARPEEGGVADWLRRNVL